MAPTLKDIWNKVTGHEQRLNDADAARASAEVIAPLKAEIQSAKVEISKIEKGIEAANVQLSADLTAAQDSIKSITTEKDGITAALVAACIAAKIEGGDEAKIKALKPAAQITALQTQVSTTLAKLQVDPAKIPAAASTQAVNQGATSMTMESFRALNPAQKQAFLKSGGTLTD